MLTIRTDLHKSSLESKQEPVEPALVLVMTHNNMTFTNNCEPYIDKNKTDVIVLNNDRTFNARKEEAVNELVQQFHAATTAKKYSNIAILLDFNLGYSGLDVCPIKQIIHELSSKPAAVTNTDELADTFTALSVQATHTKITQYCHVKNLYDLNSTQVDGNVPFYFILTGSGGETVSKNNLESLTTAQAKTVYSFHGWDIMKYITSVRKAAKQRLDFLNYLRTNPNETTPTYSPMSQSRSLSGLRSSTPSLSPTSMSLSSQGDLGRSASDGATISGHTFSSSSSPHSGSPILSETIATCFTSDSSITLTHLHSSMSFFNPAENLPVLHENHSLNRSTSTPAEISYSTSETATESKANPMSSRNSL